MIFNCYSKKYVVRLDALLINLNLHFEANNLSEMKETSELLLKEINTKETVEVVQKFYG